MVIPSSNLNLSGFRPSEWLEGGIDSGSDPYRAARRGFRPEASATARRIRLTDRESLNTLATSGSRTTTLLPFAKRRAYLPRTPPEKSYSFSMSRSRTANSYCVLSPQLAIRLPALFKDSQRGDGDVAGRPRDLPFFFAQRRSCRYFRIQIASMYAL